MNQNDFKKVDTIVSYFVKAYEKKFKSKPLVNRNKVKYPLLEMLKDMSQTEAKALIDYYVRAYSVPNLTDLAYRYDEVIEEQTVELRDLNLRKQLMTETKNSVQEFRRRFNKSDQ